MHQRRGAVQAVADAEDTRWPTVTAGIRMADGSGVPVRQPRHPDAAVEALRWSVTEGAVVQAIGRARGVQRKAGEPVFVTFLGELALPLTVQEVTTWEDALPDRLTVAAAEAALAGRALPLAPADLAAVVRDDLFPTRTAKAVSRYMEERGKTPQTLISTLANSGETQTISTA